MNKTLISGIITLLMAIAISTVAAYFSVVGLAALFAATFIPVVIMGSALELGKLVAVQWLHDNWSNPEVNWLHKSYLIIAVGALMLITSIGIYGFLSKGHLEQEAPIAGVQLQIAQRENAIKMVQDENARLQVKMDQLDANINSFLKGDKAERANAIRNKQKSERLDIEKTIKANNDKIRQISDEIVPLKMQTAEVEAKLGPVKYVAELFGWSDTGSAVRLIILIIMVAFDPLAVVLLISASISFEMYRKERQETDEEVIQEEEWEDMRVVSPRFAYTQPVEQELEEPITPPSQEEVKFVKEVIESGNVPEEIVQEVTPIIEQTSQPVKVKKPRKQKATVQPEQKEEPLTLEAYVKEAFPNEAVVQVPASEVLQADTNSNVTVDTIKTNVSQDELEDNLNGKSSHWLGKPPSLKN